MMCDVWETESGRAKKGEYWVVIDLPWAEKAARKREGGFGFHVCKNGKRWKGKKKKAKAPILLKMEKAFIV